MGALNTIYKECTGPVKIIISSRSHDGDVPRMLGDWPDICIHEDDNAEDIKAFIEHQINQLIENRWLDGVISDEFRKQLVGTLTEKAQGM
jgi:hypothetical protein